MNRRSLLKTAFGTAIALSIGLTCSMEGKDHTQEEKVIRYEALTFPEFFEAINGFPLNEEQIHSYDIYREGRFGYATYRQSGKTTLIATLALYESCIKGKKVSIAFPYYDRINYSRHEMNKLANKVKSHIVTKRFSSGYLEFSSGGHCRLMQADSVNFRGYSPDILFWDECFDNETYWVYKHGNTKQFQLISLRNAKFIYC